MREKSEAATDDFMWVPNCKKNKAPLILGLVSKWLSRDDPKRVEGFALNPDVGIYIYIYVPRSHHR